MQGDLEKSQSNLKKTLQTREKVSNLLLFIEMLELQIYHAALGSSSTIPINSKPVIQFFYTNSNFILLYILCDLIFSRACL
jgi:hypothetical protein